MLVKTYASGSGLDQDFGRALDEPFKAAFQSAPVAILMIDPHRADDPIVFANGAFSRLTGYSLSETLGRGWRFLQGSETDRETAAAVDAALRAGETIETTILCYRKGGKPFWNSLSMAPVRDAGGRIRYFISFQADVSEEYRANRELLARKRSLEEQIAVHTRDLEAALEHKTALLHEVEHRVKNSLQMIASLVLLKARRIKSPEARNVLQDMAERVGALANVHRLLYASNDVSRFNLGGFARELAGEFVSALPRGQVRLKLEVAPLGVPAAKAAPLALLLNELVGNAVKHAFPEGRQGQLTIQVERAERGLRIAVEDDGVGLHHSPAPEGSFGKALIDMLVQQLKGQLTWRDMEPGTRTEILMPVDAEETRFE